MAKDMKLNLFNGLSIFFAGAGCMYVIDRVTFDKDAMAKAREFTGASGTVQQAQAEMLLPPAPNQVSIRGTVTHEKVTYETSARAQQEDDSEDHEAVRPVAPKPRPAKPVVHDLRYVPQEIDTPMEKPKFFTTGGASTEEVQSVEEEAQPVYHKKDVKEAQNYANIYETIYQKGYHANLNYSHGVKYLMKMPQECLAKGGTMIDIGCSHGASVQYLWSRGHRASGMDVSHTGVANAKKNRIPPVSESKSCISECFRQGSATSIPWPDGVVDTLFSTEMLEHIDKADVPQVAREFRRLVKPNGMMFLGIHSRESFPGEDPLHITLYPTPWWRRHFEKAGFKLLHQNIKKNGMQLIFGAKDSSGCITNWDVPQVANWKEPE